ncbi:hypothetical protein NPIL_492001 [Nephila pilipes]|uniref:Uncharacterized protein n=1 Tax=Nephila pilipes TaxID=299642 RepID=A0A8X6MXJ8_NEPPI|nr:hypothetical protein NPIL_492001 [Nephila pilipes]
MCPAPLRAIRAFYKRCTVIALRFTIRDTVGRNRMISSTPKGLEKGVDVRREELFFTFRVIARKNGNSYLHDSNVYYEFGVSEDKLLFGRL